ncbi:LOW QUALITY PROTEIN: MerR family transcriptional regulator, partial [Streptomyces sp. C]
TAPVIRSCPACATTAAAPRCAPPRLLVAELAGERDRIDRMIGDLLRSREVLDEVIAAASGHAPASRDSGGA